MGGLSDTEPVTWEDEVATVADEIRVTSQGRMLGRGLDDAQAQNLAAWLNTLGAPDSRPSDLDGAQVERGRLLFERADVGCATCHEGARLTDNLSHTLYDRAAVNTPSLTGLAATGPYLHDGRDVTLDDLVWEPIPRRGVRELTDRPGHRRSDRGRVLLEPRGHRRRRGPHPRASSLGGRLGDRPSGSG